MFFNLKVKADMLTLQDIKDILDVIMPKREISEHEILKIIKAHGTKKDRDKCR